MKSVPGVLLVLALATAPVIAGGEILEQVLVKVNGDIFTKTELEQRQISALRQRLNQQVSAEMVKNDEMLKKALNEVTPQILVDAIDDILLVQMGREKGYKLSDEQFKSWLENLRKENKLEDDQRFQAALAQEGMTIEDLRRNVERQFLISQVQRDEIGSKLQLTEAEARQYYDLHREEFADPATVTLREILIEVPTARQGAEAGINVAQDDETAKRAADIRARVTAGEDFGKVAAQESAAPSKANGGLIGPLNVAELSTTLQQMLEKMKPGDVTQPIRTARGYQILKLETIKPASIQPFESVRDLVADKIAEGRQRTEMRRFMSRVRSQAIIEWKNDELKKLYEKQVAAMDSSSSD